MLYPPGTPSARRLEHYVRHFDTVELNSSFYRWPRPVTFASWRARYDEAVFDLLAAYGAAYCVVSGAKLPCVLRVTAPFVYLRLHGPDAEHLYAGSYSEADLRWWGDRIGEWAATGLDVYAYFNNDGQGHAVRNAETLRALLGPAGR